MEWCKLKAVCNGISLWLKLFRPRAIHVIEPAIPSSVGQLLSN